jgi:hypothetical protein
VSRDIQLRIALVLAVIALVAGLFGRFQSDDFASGFAIATVIGAMTFFVTWSVTGTQVRGAGNDL